MKKLLFIGGIIILTLTLNSCALDPESTAGKMIGDWETVHITESDMWWYYNEDGTQSETLTYEDSYDITPENEDWHILRIGTLAVSVIDTGSEDAEELLNIPFPYSIKDDQFTSLLLMGDYTNTVTVSFKDDDTMILYMNDSGYMEDNSGYEEYESWTTYRRVE